MIAVLLGLVGCQAPACPVSGEAWFTSEDGQRVEMTGDFARRGSIPELLFSEPGTLTLGEGTWCAVVAIDADLSIVGAGAEQTVLSAMEAHSVVRSDGAAVSLESLTVRDGRPADDGTGRHGGGVRCGMGSLHLTEVLLANNVAQYGGGIYASEGCAVSLSQSSIADNTALQGGGLYLTDGTLTADEATFSGNVAEESSGGGAVLLQSTMTGSAVRFTDNLTDGEGGGLALDNYSEAVLDGAVFSGNRASSGGGLHLWYHSEAVLTDPVFSDNTAESLGGGGELSGSSRLEVTGGRFEGNSAESGGGLNVFFGSRADLGGVSFTGNTGGGMLVYDSTATVREATFTANTAEQGGGIQVNKESHLTLSDSTLSDNTAERGGGIFFNNSTASLLRITFLNNTLDDLYAFETETSYSWEKEVSVSCDESGCD